MYQQLSMVYDRIRLKYNNLRITAKYSEHERDQELWSLNRPIYEEQLKRQYRDLVSRGNKNEVEAAIQFIDQVTGRGVPLRWRQMKDDFEISKRSGPAGDTYYDITLVPENVLGASEDAWTEVAIRTDEGQAVRDSTGYADVPGGGFDSQVRGVERISVKLLSAAIGRPWFDRSIFRSRGWRWAPSSGISTPLSTGQWPATGRTLLPLYPTAALFAKGLKIEGSQLDLSGSTTTGPMSLQGARVAAGSIACDGIQIMGVVCDVVPRCPDPDPSLRWL
jgi:hypothetical protein